MFRVPSRSTFPGATAPPRLAYGSRRRLVGVMQGRNGWSPNGRTFASSSTVQTPVEPYFRAPWGELEREIPYVTITTQPFPLDWWTPPSLRAAAVTRATAHPVDLLSRATHVLEPVPRARKAASAVEPEPQPANTWVAALAVMARDPGDVAAQDAPTPRAAAAPRHAPRSSRRTAQTRRGLVARLVIVAVGLVISLIAVETATRRRA